jgi:uncharacterized protein (TIGR03000 family)
MTARWYWSLGTALLGLGLALPAVAPAQFTPVVSRPPTVNAPFLTGPGLRGGVPVVPIYAPNAFLARGPFAAFPRGNTVVINNFAPPAPPAYPVPALPEAWRTRSRPRTDEVRPGGTPTLVEPPLARLSAAQVEVTLPSEAELWLDGRRINLTGTRRQFTAKIPYGSRYTCEAVAKWVDGGQEVHQTRRVDLRGGTLVQVEFSNGTPPPDATVQR